MKNIYLAALFFCVTLGLAQDKAEIQDFFWGADDPAKEVSAVPDKWKGESAVMLYKNEVYDFHKFGKRVKYVSAVRKRVKLQDKAAVQEFSEFSFTNRFYTDKGLATGAGTNTLGVKIVKPDGKEIIIDVDSEAKDVDNQKKIAISNLEPGDILDYYWYRFEPFATPFAFGFEPVETTLGDQYPIVDFKLNFKTENDFFVNFNSFNGAPELRQIPSDRGGERRYELVAKDIEKNDFPRWFYPLAELPCYKFQVYFARSGKFEKQAQAFLPEKENIVKQQVSKEDIFDFYNTKFRPYGDLGSVEKFLKGKTFDSDEEKIREVYYFARHMFFTRFIEALVAERSNIFAAFVLYGNPQFFGTEEAFINYFMAFMKDNKIDYDIVLAVPRDNGPIKDLLIEKDVRVLLRVNTPKPMFLQYFSPYTTAEQFSPDLENTDAFVLNVVKNKKVSDVSIAKLPATTAEDNVSSTLMNTSINEDMTGLKISRTTSYKGHIKEDEQNRRLYFFDYVNADYERYGTKRLEDMIRSDRKQEKYQKEYAAVVNKSKDNQKEELQKFVEDEFAVKPSDYSFSVTETGRYGKSGAMEIAEQFRLDDAFVKKAGANYIVEIGRMIGIQVEIAEKEKKRTNNIHMEFPRQFLNEIRFEIPAGYTVSGLEKLNKNVANATGGFVSSASVAGNQLIIKTRKYYSNYFEPNANWKLMVDFLEAAYQFTQEKVLLKKV